MLSALLITLREGLEAALLVGIVLAYLARTDQRQLFKSVWLGAGLAILASLVAGAAIYFTVGEFQGAAEQIFEGVALFTAVGILTWMIFWMRRQSVSIKSHLHAQIQSILAAGSALGLVGLTFIAVVREGIETVLFLFAAITIAESPVSFAVGGLLGLAIAVIIGYSIYKGTSRLNLGVFFNVTGLLLILFAAGLLAHGIGEFHEAGLIPSVVDHVWNTSNVLPDNSTLGRFVAAIFGYNASPSLVEVTAYFAYLGLVLASYFRSTASRQDGRVQADGKGVAVKVG